MAVRTVHDRGLLLPGLLTFLFGLLALSTFAGASVANVGIAESQSANCVASCVEPLGIRWDEAIVDWAALLPS